MISCDYMPSSFVDEYELVNGDYPKKYITIENDKVSVSEVTAA